MKLNVKMMLLFSAMMLAAVTVLSSYSTQLNIDSFTDLSNQQFHNISHTVSEALDQQISLMDLVLEELLDNASFMAAINQQHPKIIQRPRIVVACGSGYGTAQVVASQMSRLFDVDIVAVLSGRDISELIEKKNNTMRLHYQYGRFTPSPG